MVLGATNFTSHEIKTFEEIKIISRKYRFPRFLREENEKKKKELPLIPFFGIAKILQHCVNRTT